MKVVIINTSDRTGGAAVAANRLFKALQKADVKTSFLVRDKTSNKPDVYTVNDSRLKKIINQCRFIWERFTIFFCNKGSRKNLFQVSIANTGTDMVRNPVVMQADVIHLHWINQGLLSLRDIKTLIKTGKPIVWTLHDLWPATAICHYPGTCEKFKKECYNCPKQADKPIFDLAKQIFWQKKNIPLANITFVGCSRWITEQARLSILLQKANFFSIPNPINTEIFRPACKDELRKRLGLPINKYLILFAAAKLSDERKGVNYLLEACQQLKDISFALEIVLMGNGSEELLQVMPFPVKELGYISDERKMAMSYAASDLFVIPSLEDNLPNTVMEAMACGIPCVGFNTGGIPEMIDHLKNGYIARYKDSEDLAKGILWVLENKEKKSLSSACVEKVMTQYSEEFIAKKYIDLYKNLLEKEQ